MTEAETPDRQVEWLKMIQGAIERMARESANQKTWSVAFVGAVVVLVRVAGLRIEVLFAAIPVLAFGLLDCYYLGAEKKFRQLYNGAAGLGEEESTRPPAWTMNPWWMRDPAKSPVVTTIREGLGFTALVTPVAMAVVLVVMAFLPNDAEQESHGHQHLPQPTHSPHR